MNFWELGKSVFVIAEIGVNHDGSAAQAIQLVRGAARTGADAVKLQLFSADRLMHASSSFAEYQKRETRQATPAEMLRRYELSDQAVAQIAAEAKRLGLKLLATPFSPGDLRLISSLELPAIKIASPDLVNKPLLREAAKLRRPLLVSTGAAEMAEVETTVGWLAEWKASFALLHCVSSYPTPAEDAHLNWIGELRSRLEAPVGYSDHTSEIFAGALAVAAGAEIIEKHLTLDSHAPGPDHAASLEVEQFAEYVRLIRLARTMVGFGHKRALAIELDVRRVSRQSLVLARSVAAGKIIDEADLTVQRPGIGVPAAEIDRWIGRRALRCLKRGRCSPRIWWRANMPRRICFVTGTRAEFGLMRSALLAIQSHRNLTLQIVATGMHLDRSRGNSLRTIREEGWHVDGVVPWKTGVSPAEATGRAMAELAKLLERLKTDIVLVVGDRVEAFAAAGAAAIGRRVLAHVHGGDRALGQVDDSLRHAITKLAHVHFPATRRSAARLVRLGEERWRIHPVGSPGIDGIVEMAGELCAGLTPKEYALLVLHPIDGNAKAEERRAETVLRGVLSSGVGRVVLVYPNNDPGADGIVRAWRKAEKNPRCMSRKNLSRGVFLGLLRDAAMLVGNSSCGIIEAASFKTPVVDIGPRQLGRERAADVIHAEYDRREIAQAAKGIWNNGKPRLCRAVNPYAGDGQAGRRMAEVLGRLQIGPELLGKLITY